ncbi:MAG TPA: hypothetical protein DCS93_18820, partial [Microscillaceae bacterium]|nr:hypothetical protein [Microscillaceae bacterium]
MKIPKFGDFFLPQNQELVFNNLNQFVMRAILIFFFVLWIGCLELTAQSLPTLPNKTNAQGRQGEWCIWYNKDWKVTKDSTQVKFYRLISYRDDLPQDTVKDYYHSGKIQWKGHLLKDRPKEVMDGKCLWYYEDGGVEAIEWIEEGELLKGEYYHPNGTKKDWLPSIEQGLKYFQIEEYERAWPILELYKCAVLFFSEGQAKIAYGFLQILAICYKKTGQLIKAKKLIPNLEELKMQLANTWENLNKKGVIAHQTGKYTQARDILEKAKSQAIKEFGIGKPEYATACNNLAGLYYEFGLYKKSEPLLIEAKSIIEKVLGKEHPNYVRSCNNLAKLYHTQGLYKKSELLYIEAKNISEKILGKHHPDYATYCSNLALLYITKGLYKKSKPLLIEAEGIVVKTLGKNHPDYAISCDNLARLYRALGKYKKSELLLIEAKQKRERILGKNHPDYARSCHNLAVLYEAQGLYKKSELLYVETGNIIAKVLGKNHPDYITSCHNLALFYGIQGLHKKSELLLIETKQKRERILGKNHPDYASSCNSLAELYRVQGLYKKSELLHTEAKNIFEKILGKNHPNYAGCCNNLALLYKTQDDYCKAEQLYLEAKNIREKVLGKDHPDYAISCDNLANLYNAYGLYEKSKSLYIEAKNIFKKTLGKRHIDYATSCDNLAESYKKLGNYNKAELLYVEAKNIREKVLGRGHTGYAISCDNLAGLYKLKGLYNKSEPLLIEAKSIFEKVLGKNHLDYAISCGNLAGLYNEQGLYKKSESLYLEGKNIFEGILGKNHFFYATFCGNLATFYKAQGKYYKSASLFREIFNNTQRQVGKKLVFSSEVGRQYFLKANINYYYEFYNSFTQSYIDSLGIAQSDSVLTLMYNNRLLTKSLLFNSTEKTKQRIYASKDTALIHQYEAFVAQRVLYNKALELTKTEREKRGWNLQKMADKADSLEKALARKSTEFAQVLEEYQSHTWQEVQQQLKPGEAAIEIIRFNKFNKRWTDTVHYAALILTPQSKHPYPVFLKNGDFMEGQAFQYYQKRNTHRKTQGADLRSYAHFWQPIQDTLRKIYPSATRLYLSLDGVYHQINLGTLYNPSTKQYLGDQLDLRLVSNTKDLLPRKIRPRSPQLQDSIRVFGFPDYACYSSQPISPGQTHIPAQDLPSFRFTDLFKKGHIPLLNGTREEARKIQHLMNTHRVPAKSYIYAEATEENIKALQSPRILHLATHGYFLQDKDLRHAHRQQMFQLGGIDLKQYIESPLLRCGLLWTGAQATLQAPKQPQQSRPTQVTDNGFLNAQEVLNLNLDNTDLVVLSACET